MVSLRAKAICLAKIDAKERKWGLKKGLDTQVSLSATYEWLVIQLKIYINTYI